MSTETLPWRNPNSYNSIVKLSNVNFQVGSFFGSWNAEFDSQQNVQTWSHLNSQDFRGKKNSLPRFYPSTEKLKATGRRNHDLMPQCSNSSAALEQSQLRLTHTTNSLQTTINHETQNRATTKTHQLPEARCKEARPLELAEGSSGSSRNRSDDNAAPGASFLSEPKHKLQFEWSRDEVDATEAAMAAMAKTSKRSQHTINPAILTNSIHKQYLSNQWSISRSSDSRLRSYSRRECYEVWNLNPKWAPSGVLTPPSVQFGWCAREIWTQHHVTCGLLVVAPSHGDGLEIHKASIREQEKKFRQSWSSPRRSFAGVSWNNPKSTSSNNFNRHYLRSV